MAFCRRVILAASYAAGFRMAGYGRPSGHANAVSGPLSSTSPALMWIASERHGSPLRANRQGKKNSLFNPGSQKKYTIVEACEVMKLLFQAAVFTGIVLPFAGAQVASAQATIFGTNLIVNAGAESGAGGD